MYRSCCTEESDNHKRPYFDTVFTIVTNTMRLLSTVVLSSIVSAACAVADLKITLRGKKYTVSDVESVKDLEDKMQELSGEKGRLLFGGKRLNSEDILTDAGVLDGSALNMVPGGKNKPASKSNTVATSAKPDSNDASLGLPDMGALSSLFGGDGAGGMPSMEDIMKNMPKGMEMPSMDESVSTIAVICD